METLRFNLMVEPTSLNKEMEVGRKRVMGTPRFLVEQLVYSTGMEKTACTKRSLLNVLHPLCTSNSSWHIKVNGSLALWYISLFIFKSYYLLILNKVL